MQPCAPGLIDKHGFRRSARRITPRYDRARARPLCRKSTAIRRLINTVFDMRAAPARQSENHRCRVTLPEISQFADVPLLPPSPPLFLPACLRLSNVSRMPMDIISFFPMLMNINGHYRLFIKSRAKSITLRTQICAAGIIN